MVILSKSRQAQARSEVKSSWNAWRAIGHERLNEPELRDTIRERTEAVKLNSAGVLLIPDQVVRYCSMLRSK
jgi:hypothetical protein